MRDSFENWNNLETIAQENAVLISGTTGSGKSVLLEDLIYILSTHNPRDVQIGIIDLKKIQFTRWERLPHLDSFGIAGDMKSALAMLDKIIRCMESRYYDMKKTETARYEGTRICLFIDEMFFFENNIEFYNRLENLLRLGNASNISVFCATQGPSKRIIPDSLYYKMSCTIGLRTASRIESRQIIGEAGCERLPQYGEAYMWNRYGISKIQIPYTDEEAIIQRVKEWK